MKVERDEECRLPMIPPWALKAGVENLRPADCVELADYMIARWQEFRAKLGCGNLTSCPPA
ncbi:MAG: hypothetical protein ACREXW_00895 [Gammaproteobacteria bacterium]